MTSPLTIPQTFLSKYQNSYSNCIGAVTTGAIKWLSSDDLIQEVVARIEGLKEYSPEKSTVAILGDTSLVWHLCDLALMLSGHVVTPLYPTLTAEELAFIVKDSKAKLILVENQKLFDKIKGVLPSDVKFLSFREPIQGLDALIDLQCERPKDECLSLLNELAQIVAPTDLASLVYTSGTTGRPKGVMISHEAFATMLQNVAQVFKGKITEDDCNLVFLPLSHVLGRCDSLLHLVFPVKTAFSRGFNYLTKDLLIARPSIMISVPRVFEKIYEGVFIKMKAMSFLKRSAFDIAESVSKKYFKLIRRDEAPDLATGLMRDLSYKLVYQNIYKQLGGKIRFFVSGGAPLNSEIFYFFERAGITILEGYGLTETVAPCCLNPIRRPIVATVGIPMGEVQIKLADDQEILIKSKALFSGYWGMPEESEKVMKDGWFYTGDIGEWTSEGHLKITDRKKDLIITSGGKNVAPQKIENLLLSSPFLSQAVVIGERRKYLSALIVLNFDMVRQTADQLGLAAGLSAHELCQHPAVIELVQKVVDETNKELAQYETLKKFHLLEQEFSLENGQLTPSLKPKRKVIGTTYKAQIDAMYQ